MSQSLTERYDARIAGVLSCYDRVMITGTLPTVCYAAGMARYLHLNEIPIFDYATFAHELNGQVRERAAALAAEAGVRIEHINKAHVRKTWLRVSWRNAVGIPAWCTSSRRWKAAPATAPATMPRPGATCSAPPPASACITISISSTPRSG
jgi:hypothetical protein